MQEKFRETDTPVQLLTAEQTRRLDRRLIDEQGIAGIVLMKRAGRAVFEVARRRWPDRRHLSVVCGKGNNAGDGYIVAGLACDRGCRVQLIQLGDASALSGDAAAARDWALARGLCVESVDADAPRLAFEGTLIIDALLGTGLRGNVRPGYADAIEQINDAELPVLAVDVPSGLCPDRGIALAAAVAADVTVTLIGAKRGLFTGAGRELAGEVVFDTLAAPPELLETEVGTPVLRWRSLRGGLPVRRANAHKTQFGHVLVVGGDHGMGGAVSMAAEAALRVGAGLVSVATRPEHVPVLLARRPELMVRGMDGAGELSPLLSRATLIAVGPGLGQSAWSRELLHAALAAAAEPGGPALVIDADALNLVAADGLTLPAQSLITPHPGEAGRLLRRKASEVEADRFAAASDLARRFGAATILKGAGSIVAAPRGLLGVCLEGNPAMATAGMGDVLTGVAAGLRAQGLDCETAATMAVTLHAAAGDLAAATRPRGVTATDLLSRLRELLNDTDP